MKTKMCNLPKPPSGWWLISLLSVVGFAAPSADLRLADAVQNKDRQAVRSLLAQRADVNAPQSDGSTALAWAAHWDDLETADLLIRAGADVNAANHYGATPLWLACTNANEAMVERLLRAGADPNAALETGETPLMAAAEKGRMVSVKLLLASGADVNAREKRGGQTALMWALAERHPEVAQMLIERGASVKARSKGGFTPLMFASQQGDVASARMLLTAGANANDQSAPEPGAPSVGNSGYGGGLEPSGSMTPLSVAIASAQNPVAMLLLEHGANPNVMDGSGYTPLHYSAAGRNTLELAKALLVHGADPNVRLGKVEDRRDPIGATPFYLAAEARNAPIMRALAAAGADPKLKTTETVFFSGANGVRLQSVADSTPIMIAAGMGRNPAEYSPKEEQDALEAAKAAVELGVDINAVNAYGWTALHVAAYIGADSIIQYLAEKGAKLDVIDQFGQTPLSIASRIITVDLGANFDARPRRERPTTMNLLLKFGATPWAKSGVQPALQQ